MIGRLLLYLGVLLTGVGQAAVLPVGQDPTKGIGFTGYVVDRAAMLTPAQRRHLADRLGRFQRTTHHQMAVVTVTDLGGEDVATFATRLANRWGVGRRGYDDGVLLLIAPNEHATRIAVGRGIERQLTHRFCQSVLDDRILPAFRRGRFADGIEAGVTAIIARLARADHAAPISGARRAA